ncbi:hypothetical protein [Tautonia sociabilis]|uniref:Uncharacterized protein n=1 Tax=Tautonia sociabilis TaxID=2080755 RepID=A0A432MEC7_9BACT|nr:hypothetical protein [Tautonia sociabilis]RUL83659.1 hypothetical protein TsocGM_21745 [Tautonia sociabilis]
MSTPTEHPDPNPSATPQPDPTPAAPAAPAGKPKAKVSPTRNAISLVLLIVLVVIGGLELLALFQFNGAVDKLDQALEANEQDLLPRTTVEEILGKEPDGPLQDAEIGTQSTTYTWRGALRHHKLTAYYSRGESPGLVKYEIGDAEAETPTD